MITVRESADPESPRAALMNNGTVSGDPVFGRILKSLYELQGYGPWSGDAHTVFAEYLGREYPTFVVERLLPLKSKPGVIY